MILSGSADFGSIVEHFDDLSGYEKGVLARALTKSLVKQGHLETIPNEKVPGRINISIEEWQLRLLARLNEDGDDVDDETEDEKEILLNKLCELR